MNEQLRIGRIEFAPNRPGWDRINDIRTAVLDIPIRQLPEAPRLRVADSLNDLMEYTNRLEAEHCALRDLARRAVEALAHYGDEAMWSLEPDDGQATAYYPVFTYDGGHDEPWHVARELLRSPLARTLLGEGRET